MFHTPEKLDRFIRTTDPAFDQLRTVELDAPQSSSTLAGSDRLGDTASSAAADIPGPIFFSKEPAPQFNNESPSDALFYGNPRSASNPVYAHKSVLEEIMGVPKDLFSPPPSITRGQVDLHSTPILSSTAINMGSRGTSPLTSSIPESPTHHTQTIHSLRQSPLSKSQHPPTYSPYMQRYGGTFPQTLRSFHIPSLPSAGPVMSNSTPPTTPRKQKIVNSSQDDRHMNGGVPSPPMRLGMVSVRRGESPYFSSTPSRSPKPNNPSPAHLGTPRTLLTASPYSRLPPPRSPFVSQPTIGTQTVPSNALHSPEHQSSYRTLDAPGISANLQHTPIAWGNICQVAAVFDKTVFMWSPDPNEAMFKLFVSPSASITVVATSNNHRKGSSASRASTVTDRHSTPSPHNSPDRPSLHTGATTRSRIPSPHSAASSKTIMDQPVAAPPPPPPTCYVAIGLSDGLIHLFEFASFREVAPLPPIAECTSAITSMEFVDDLLYCGTIDGDLVAFRIQPNAAPRVIVVWKLQAAGEIDSLASVPRLIDTTTTARIDNGRNRAIPLGRLSPPPPMPTFPISLERRPIPLSTQLVTPLPTYHQDYALSDYNSREISPRLDYVDRDEYSATEHLEAPSEPILERVAPASPSLALAFAPPPQLPNRPPIPLPPPPVARRLDPVDPFLTVNRQGDNEEQDTGDESLVASTIIEPITPVALPPPPDVVNHAAIFGICVSSDGSHVAVATINRVLIYTLHSNQLSLPTSSQNREWGLNGGNFDVNSVRGPTTLKSAKALAWCGHLIVFAAGPWGNVIVARSPRGSSIFERDVGCEIFSIRTCTNEYSVADMGINSSRTVSGIVVSQGAALPQSPASAFTHFPTSIVIYMLVDMEGTRGQLRPTMVFSGHTEPAIHMCISPDGQKVLTAAAGIDNTLRFWEIKKIARDQPEVDNGHDLR